MSELKPGEYVGADGLRRRAHLHYSVEHGEDWLWPVQDRVLPDDPDFPAAVEALQKLVPEPFEWVSGVNGIHYRYHNGHVECCVRGVWTFSLDDDAVFEAGRRYERERGHADE